VTVIRPEIVGQRSETVRRANLSAIVRALHADGPLSRSDLVARTGLTRSAIRGLVGELAADGVVSEERPEPLGVPGRPSPLVRLVPDRAVVLALDIAVDSLAVAIVGLGGEVLDLERVDRPRGHLAVDDTVADLAELAARIQARQPALADPIGIGVAVVGVVRRTDGLVSIAPNLGWHDAPLGARLARSFGAGIPIQVANDADLGALAEHRRGVAVSADHVLFICGDVGVGGGLIVDGSPLTGTAGYGGEIGHIPVNPNGVACRCGSVGCWETEVGVGTLLARAGHAPGGGRDEVAAVLEEARAGAVPALRALDEVGRWLGFGIAGLVNVLNPELIVLGGLFGQIHPFVARVVDGQLDRLTLAAPRRLVRVVPATLDIDAPLLGAAELAFEPFLGDPAEWLRPQRDHLQLVSA
jgi:predicted NBD/HSP70 family sugar kinase